MDDLYELEEINVLEKKMVEYVEESKETQIDTIEFPENPIKKLIELKNIDFDAIPYTKPKVGNSDIVQKLEWAVQLDISKPVTDFNRRVPKMAIEYDFELDNFQKKAIMCIEEGNSVFVAAHTSAGKTVVAEYAIALSKRHMTKTIYTSPIKALSNQKYRDFKSRFSDVGILTGDVKIKENASCLIMTTEILRLMLYNNFDCLRDLEYVIFDEVHYINNAERGVVWEEVLIMLPDYVKLVLLSATAPNYMKFANWIGKIKRKQIYVLSTSVRPVPLEHYLYIGGKGGDNKNTQFLLMKDESTINKFKYEEAKTIKAERAGKSKQQYGPKAPRTYVNLSKMKSLYLTLIRKLEKEDKLPAVCFTLSRKRCDEYSSSLDTLDLTTKSEKDEIHKFFKRCTDKLRNADQKLPQIMTMTVLLSRGIGIHHSGILPVLKEIVEMLFQRGLVKLLFATETFAMGVNMPTKTVIFGDIRKHDGKEFRYLHASEYIQMAGRAGRRGIDTIGNVLILAPADVPDLCDLSNMMIGKPTDLDSQFRLSYKMMLSLLHRRVNINIEQMMRESFLEDNNQNEVEKGKDQYEALLEKRRKFPSLQCLYCQTDILDYAKLSSELHDMRLYMMDGILSSNYCSRTLLCPGRIVIIENEYHTSVLALILEAAESKEGKLLALASSIETGDQKIFSHDLKLFNPGENMHYTYLRSYPLELIKQITSKVIRNFNIDALIADCNMLRRQKSSEMTLNLRNVLKELRGVAAQYSQGLPLPSAKEQKSVPDNVQSIIQKIGEQEKSLEAFNCLNCPDINEHYLHEMERQRIEKEIENYEMQMSAENLIFSQEYKIRLQVLRELEYVDKEESITLKGRVAKEMSMHELIISELIFEGAFNQMTPPEIASVLSCLVSKNDLGEGVELSEEQEKLFTRFLSITNRIGEVQKDYGLANISDAYSEEFKKGLIPVVHNWANGMTFCEITKLTSIQEGIIVQSILRIYELLKNVLTAAKLIGNSELQDKARIASESIHRDIVFSPSLYHQQV